MATATVFEHIPSMKPLELHNSDEGTHVIRFRLDGVYLPEILADQSETQGQLLELLNSLQPALDDVLRSLR